MQVLPSPSLAHIVRHYLIIENAQIGNVSLRIFSDGNTGMVFNFGNPLLVVEENTKTVKELPAVFVYGQPETFRNIISTGGICIFIVVFHPFGISTLLKIPAIELKNKIVDLEIFFPAQSQILADQIFSSLTLLSKIQNIENFLVARLSDNPPKSEIMQYAVDLIQRQNGNLTVSQLLTNLQVNERKLQRTFEEHVGLSPKRFSGVIRVQYFLKLLRNDPDASLTKLVYDAGFFDQAHLIRQMKHISGITPGQYMVQSNLLAANFLKIP